jgi:hypothetical protein
LVDNNITQEQLEELALCGVFLDSDTNNSLAMFA